MMKNTATNLYGALCMIHLMLWVAFGATWVVMRYRSAARNPSAIKHSASGRYAAPYARSILTFHLLAFCVLYIGMVTLAVRGTDVFFGGRHYIALGLMCLGIWLVWWAIASLRSWRFMASLDPGHELVTSGAFRLVRHPIYCGVNLIALGSGIWAPSFATWSGVVLTVVGSELRARAEEAVLMRAFGEGYIEYCSRSSRFLPGVY